jgi:hypothetical protein
MDEAVASLLRTAGFSNDTIRALAPGVNAIITQRIAEARKHEGNVVVTKNSEGVIVTVTRQDEEGRIISVISESSTNRSNEGEKANG